MRGITFLRDSLPSGWGGVAVALPNLLMVGIFYSLAIHMWVALGQWPSAIGEIGFPSGLRTHGEIAWFYCGILMQLSLIIVPVGMVLAMAAERWRTAGPYLGLYAVLYVFSWCAMLMAPAPFLHWWWD